MTSSTHLHPEALLYSYRGSFADPHVRLHLLPVCTPRTPASELSQAIPLGAAEGSSARRGVKLRLGHSPMVPCAQLGTHWLRDQVKILVSETEEA